MTDRLHPTASTWRQPIPEPTSVVDVPAWWRLVSATEPDPVKADDYLRLADTLDSFIAMRGRI